jgi:regulator of protease activity HflC (stomatin/prohibitin superfamily)
MAHSGSAGTDTGTINKLRSDVLKQAEASLSALIGKVHFSDTFSAATQLQYDSHPAVAGVVPGRRVSETNGARPEAGGSSSSGSAPPPEAHALLFDLDKLRNAVSHANHMTTRYGVEVLSINIISAKPADKQLMQSLAKGAVAAAEAQQQETAARGQAKANTIAARGEADALKISAQADADADVTRAEGRRQAAKLLNEEEVAVSLATISATGEALGKAKSNLILAKEPGQLNSMMLVDTKGEAKMLQASM